MLGGKSVVYVCIKMKRGVKVILGFGKTYSFL